MVNKVVGLLEVIVISALQQVGDGFSDCLRMWVRRGC